MNKDIKRIADSLEKIFKLMSEKPCHCTKCANCKYHNNPCKIPELSPQIFYPCNAYSPKPTLNYDSITN